ncbi:MAG TPA: hypothetical protein P5257_10260 [Bacteroidales bacterium]|nr:hypothetical protein [Bacteroidales bacterium]HRR92617.1 hypothetical protein [Bacteroidales bacterium]HRT90489.1 hypothetical protein [Bacteroidales bacterium]
MKRLIIVIGSGFLVLFILNLYLQANLRSKTEELLSVKTHSELRSKADSALIENQKEALLAALYLSDDSVLINIAKCTYYDGNSCILVLFIQKDYCFSCIRNILMDFEIIQKETGFCNIFIVAGAGIDESLDKQIYDIKPDLNFSLIKTGFSLPVNPGFPFVFIIEKGCRLKYFFIPGLLPEKRSEYFFKLLTDYLSRNV